MNGIADTGFLVAFAAAGDEYHDWAVALAEEGNTPFLTCESVLAETAFHLGSVSIVTGMLREGLISLAFSAADHVAQLEALAIRYKDRKSDLADLCLVRMSELYPHHSVITIDREDFRIYRRNRREMIPLICPR